MNNLKISTKFIAITLIVTTITMIIGYFLLDESKKNIEKDVLNKTVLELQYSAETKISSKLDVGISNAISISNDSQIQESLYSNNRDLGIRALSSLSQKMKESTPFKNIKIHVHNKNSYSFIRSWKLDKYGDDLNSFRSSVVKVNSEKKAVNTFEVGKAGLSIRSVVPIFKESEHVGSLEFMQGINSVAKQFDKNGDAFILLMDSKKAVADTSKLKKIDNYIVSQKFLNEDFYNDSLKIDFTKLLANNFYTSDKYFYTYYKIVDFKGEELGIALVGRDIHVVDGAIDAAGSIIVKALTILFIALFISLIASLVNLKQNVINPIKKLKDSIDGIKNNTSSNSTRIEQKSNDEIGEVVVSFNTYLDTLDEWYEKDKKVIEQTRLIIAKVNKGLLNDRVDIKGHSEAVNLLVSEVNSMIGVLQTNLITLSDVLVNLSNAKYDAKLPDVKLTGLIGSIFSGIKVTQSTINEVMCLIDNANSKLTSSAQELSSASENLSTSSNSQAASLEETAAAVQEISSTIESSSQTAQKMSQYAKNVSESNEKGKQLAFKTGDSMEELSTKVNAINEAIVIIDQIAFQTNILSLNAAVEAATAGEAGKGFAVVAQEVRNLAARSSDAAKEIKELVEDANNKAVESKEISNQMIEGYNSLNDSITTTIELIEDVANASREQQLAMGQINETITTLDRSTQQNASLASTINDMSNLTSTLAHQLQNAINRTSFDESAKDRICDEDMIFDANKLKSDHINFKNVNFSECRKGHNFTVKTHHECNLGKWIDSMEETKFAKTAQWPILKDAHQKVHTLVQETVNLYANNATNEEIFNTTDEIEKNINIVFESLNDIRVQKCKNN